MAHWTVDYLTSVLEKKDWSMNRLATEADVASTTINRPLKKPEDWPFGLSARTVAKIHAATGIDPAPYIPRDMHEPVAMYRAPPETMAARVLRDMDKPGDHSEAAALARNDTCAATLVRTE